MEYSCAPCFSFVKGMQMEKKHLKISLFALMLLILLCGCAPENENMHIVFPYQAEQDDFVEMFHHSILRGKPVSVEKKIVTEAEDIHALLEGL